MHASILKAGLVNDSRYTSEENTHTLLDSRNASLIKAMKCSMENSI